MLLKTIFEFLENFGLIINFLQQAFNVLFKIIIVSICCNWCFDYLFECEVPLGAEIT